MGEIPADGVARPPDSNRRWEELAREAATRFGDVAVVTRVQPDEGVIAAVAACHRDKAHEEAARRVVGVRYRRGEAIPGRVWESERGLLLVDVDSVALATIVPENSRKYVREIGLRSMMIVPIWEGGRVLGTLGVARDAGRHPYTEPEFDQLAAMAVLTPIG